MMLLPVVVHPRKTRLKVLTHVQTNIMAKSGQVVAGFKCIERIALPSFHEPFVQRQHCIWGCEPHFLCGERSVNGNELQPAALLADF
jgi:hypothetical protein